MAEPAKKKPDLAVVIGVGKPMGAPHAEPDDDDMGGKPDNDEDDAAYVDAMSEMKSALDGGDMGKAVEAFKVLMKLCSSEEGGEDYSEEK